MIFQAPIFVATDTYSRVLRRAACAYSICLSCSQRLDTSSALPLTYIQVSHFLSMQRFVRKMLRKFIESDSVPLSVYVVADLDSTEGIKLMREAVASLVGFARGR